MPYPKTEPKADFPKLEQEILAFWRADDTFHKSLKKQSRGILSLSMTGHRLQTICHTGDIWGYLRSRIWLAGIKQCADGMWYVNWGGIVMDYQPNNLLKKARQAGQRHCRR